MITIEEIRKLPEWRLEEVYQYIQTLKSESNKESTRQNIMSFAGLFSDMSDDEYEDFKNNLEHTRRNLFTRTF